MALTVPRWIRRLGFLRSLVLILADLAMVVAVLSLVWIIVLNTEGWSDWERVIAGVLTILVVRQRSV